MLTMNPRVLPDSLIRFFNIYLLFFIYLAELGLSFCMQDLSS